MGENTENLTVGILKQLLGEQQDERRKEITEIKEQINSSTKSIMSNTNEQFAAIRGSISGLQETANAHEKRMDNQQSIISNQERQIEANTGKIKNLEIALRKRNLIFHGIPETEENEENLKEILLKIIKERMTVNINPCDFEFLYRIGRKEGNGGKIRPVLVGFISYPKKQSVLHIKSKMSPYGVSEDYPKEVTEARKKLVPYMQKFKEEGKKVMFKVDKLIVDGKVWEEPNNQPKFEELNNKRKSDDTSPQGNDNKKSAPSTSSSSITKNNSEKPPSTPTTHLSTPSKNFPMFQLNKTKESGKNILTQIPGGTPNDKAFEFRSNS